MPQDLLAMLNGADTEKTSPATGESVDLFEMAGFKPEPKKVEKQGVGRWLADAALDVGKRAGGAALSGLASIPEALQSGVRATVRNGASGDAATVMPAGVFMPGIDDDSTIYGEETQVQRDQRALAGERAAAAVKIPGAATFAQVGRKAQEAINDSTSQATKDAVANSQVTGNLLKGEIDFGKNPSVRGFLMQGADVFGSMLPVVATALATKSPTAAGAVGGGMAAGEGVQNARDFVAKQTDAQLLQNSPLYKRMVDAGASIQEAREIVSAKAEDTSALLQGAVAAVGDRFTGKLVTGGLDPMIARMAGKSVIAKTAAGAGVSSLEQGTQELGEGIASDIGIKALSDNKEIGEDSAANFVLGALGGAAPGAARGAVVRPQESGQNTAPVVEGQAPEAINSEAPTALVENPKNSDSTQSAPGRAAMESGAPSDQGRALYPDGTPDTMDAGTAELRLAELEVIDSSAGLSAAQQTERAALAERVAVDKQREADLEAIGEAPESSTNQPAAQDQQAPAAINSEVAFDPAATRAQTWPQFVAERGEKVSTLRKGTEAWDRLQNEWAAVKTKRAGTNPEGTGAAGAPTPEIQNRDRSRPASVVQMQGMAQNPDYMRLGVSRSPESGAPMAFAVGDQVHAAHTLGRADTAVMSDGQRVPFQYAVMESADVQPSNFADGNPNPLFDAAHPGVVKALNNGRTAGLRAAYERGTADNYRRELVADADLHGIEPTVIDGMKAPVLVRLYSERDNQANMGAKSQSQALGLSATEQAATDAALMDPAVLDVFDSGDLDSAANRDFARAFIGRLQAEGQDIAGMMDANGALSPAGVTRLQAALVHKAYSDGDLVESMFGSTDTDIRAIGEALKAVAGEWANLRRAAQIGAVNPQVDVTGNLLQAIRLVQKARRERASLYDAINQVDMVTGDVVDETTVGVLRLMYSGQYLTRALGRDRVVESLREYVGAALATSAEGDMFGEQVGPDAILSALSGQPNQQATDAASNQPTRQPAPESAQGERGATGSDAAGGSADGSGQQAQRPIPDRAGETAPEPGGSGEGQAANDPERQPDRQSDQGAGEDGSGALAPELELASYTPEEVTERQEAQERADEQRAQEDARAEAEARAARDRKEVDARMDDSAENFQLGEDADDAVSGQGGLLFRRPPANPGTADPGATAARREADAAIRRDVELMRKVEQLEGDKRLAETRQLADQLMEGWTHKPDLVVVRDLEDPAVPEVARRFDAKQSRGSSGSPKGFYLEGRVFLLSDALSGPQDIAETLFHETLGHYGLKAHFGERLKPILRQIVVTRRADVAEKAKNYRLDMDVEEDRLTAAEEVLADMAEKQPNLGFVRRAVAEIRAWLRKHVPALRGMKMTDAELIAKYILPARNFVMRSRAAESGSGGISDDQIQPAFSRAPDFDAEVDAAIAAGMKGEAPGRKPVAIGETSPALQAAGIPAGPMRTAPAILAKAVFDHGVTKSLLKKLPDLLDNPVMVFESDSVPGRYVVVTSEFVAGRPLIVAISPEETRGSVAFNFVPSLYPKDDMAAISRWMAAGKLRYLDKEQSPQWLGSARLQLPGEYRSAKGLQARNVATNEDVVKGGEPDIRFKRGAVKRGHAATDTPAFREWFGDSKVVDAEGKPLVVYHGTGAPEINVFDLSRAGQNGRAEGSGIYFTTDRSIAEGYGQRGTVVEAFVSINKPLEYRAKPFNPAQMQKLLSELATREAQENGRGWQDGFLANYVDTYSKDFPAAVREASKPFADEESAIDQLGGLIGSGVDAQIVNEALTAALGYDGYRSAGFSGEGQLGGTIWVAFRSEQIKSATGNSGTFDPASPDIRFKRGPATESAAPGVPVPQGKLAQLQAKARALTSRESVDAWLYNWQDKFIDLKRIQQSIKELNGTVSETNDAYRGEELYHKRVAKRAANFLRDEVRPLLKAMNGAKVTIEDFERFLHARHAPEANRVMAERNPNAKDLDVKRAAADKAVIDLQRQLQHARAAGTSTVALQKALGMALLEQDKWNSAEAFTGTDDERLSLSGMSDQEAAGIMASYPAAKRQALDGLAMRVDRINDGTLKTLEGYGLMDGVTLAAWRKTYQHYVPLHRDEAHPDSKAHPIGQGFSTKGASGKQRTGSNEKVTNILSHIVMQREAALTRGEKNNVVKKLYLLAAQNPDDSIWRLDLPQKKAVDPDTGLVRTMVDQGAKLRDNVVTVRIGGKDKHIVFNERNERAVRLAVAVKNLDATELDRFTRTMGSLTRWFAAVNTQYNPVFGVMNLARDLQGSMLQLSTTPLAGKQGEVFKNIRSNMAAIYQDLRRERREVGAGQGPWAQLWEQMQLDGGTTGYRDLYADPKDRAEALQKALDQQGQGKAAAAARGALDWLSDFNETLEASTRLAVYKAALDSGLSRGEAASISKNITVNFNRKGRNTSVVGSYFAFLNAAIQGNTRMLETLTGPAGKKIMLGGVALGMLSSFAGQLVMGGGGADDEWKKIPEFVKERSIIIPLGRKDYVAIPLPLGFHVFPNIGRKMVDAFMHDDPTTSRATHLLDLALIAVNAYNPLGGSENLALMVTPTPFDPVVSLMANKDWTGKGIYKEQRSALDPKPGHAMAKDSATPVSRWVARFVNDATGGNEWKPGAVSPNPDALEYLFGQFTGGVGRELTKVGNMATAATSGEELAPHQITLFGRIYGNTSGVNGQSTSYYENLKRVNVSMAEAKGRVERGESAEAVLLDVPLAKVDGAANVLDNRVSELVKMRRRIQASDAPNKRELVKEVNTQVESSMYLLNKAVDDALKTRSEQGG